MPVAPVQYATTRHHQASQGEDRFFVFAEPDDLREYRDKGRQRGPGAQRDQQCGDGAAIKNASRFGGHERVHALAGGVHGCKRPGVLRVAGLGATRVNDGFGGGARLLPHRVHLAGGKFFRDDEVRNVVYRIHEPPNREKLMAADPQALIAAMTRWSKGFIDEAGYPVIGATEAQLRSIKAPACVIPGNDNTHPKAVGETLARLLPDATLNILFAEHLDVDVVPPEAWAVKEKEMAAMLLTFLNNRSR